MPAGQNHSNFALNTRLSAPRYDTWCKIQVLLSSYWTFTMQMPASELMLFKKTRTNIFDDFTEVAIQIFNKINIVMSYYKHCITVSIKLLKHNSGPLSA